VNGTRKFAKHI